MLKRYGLWVLLLGVFQLCVAVAWAQPVFKSVGQGQYSYLFWDLYHAVLYSEDGRFLDYQHTRPLKLALTYQRTITVEEFVDATLAQWKLQHGALTPAQKRWAGELRRIWRDVKAGDKLACVYTQAGDTEFWLNDELLGTVSDQSFGPEFLDIWLGDKTSEPKLRQQLLGLRK